MMHYGVLAAISDPDVLKTFLILILIFLAVVLGIGRPDFSLHRAAETLGAQNLNTADRFADHHGTVRIDAMDLKNVLRNNVERGLGFKIFSNGKEVFCDGCAHFGFKPMKGNS